MSDYVFCRITKDCGKAAPGDFHRREHDFKKGDVLQLLKWPSERLGFSYWTSADIDFAFIFEPSEVEEITEEEYKAAEAKRRKR